MITKDILTFEDVTSRPSMMWWKIPGVDQARPHRALHPYDFPTEHWVRVRTLSTS